MNCGCCSTELKRAIDLPGMRGSLRLGDRFCTECRWPFPRELLHEFALPERLCCPTHGSEPRHVPARRLL
jgi:hypothetical protein